MESDGIEEWMMVEMQGTVENSGRPLSDEVLGSLSWRRDDNEALLLVGHHLLEGKVGPCLLLNITLYLS
ncbi:hypothetical protein OESDEN_17040 [Oesophagostomum dentatum]|uniref:Ctf8 n=1 Tax=Oesophagostomum dentatum TaxID=61180 RepID=A0A0B1SD85_OESDE|nr:hypothetical protein OESDEN_17040 [Oesophagostomum dentatum]